jgi:hypothetical protein
LLVGQGTCLSCPRTNYRRNNLLRQFAIAPQHREVAVPGTRQSENEQCAGAVKRRGGLVTALSTSLLLLLGTRVARAQRPATSVRVHVADSAARPIAGASVELFRGLTARVANLVTDSAGVATLTAPRDEELELVVRRIGFQRRSVFFRSDTGERRFEVTLQRSAVSLPAVDVTAARDLNRERYHLEADDIEHSKRPILDGLDAVLKLRPDMAEPPNDGIYAHCGLYNLFVNGMRVRYPPVNDAVAEKVIMQRRAAILATQPGRLPHYSTQARIPISIQSALASIRPEHIEELNYVLCSDTKSTDVVRAQNGLFVVLKRGVAFEPGRGSYVVASDAIAEKLPREVVAASVANGSSANFRARVAGVFDQETGKPLAGVDVVDLRSSTVAKTTSSGTVSLAFLPEGPSEVAVRRAGYAELRLTVTISPVDTLPLTLVMRAVP